MKDCEHLTDKQERYAQYLAAGMESQAAAKKAGYSNSFAKVAGFRMKKKPSVAKALASIQAEGRKMAAYDLTRAMEESAEVMELAKLHKHPTAFFFAVRHRAHLSGLLVDEIHLKTENLDLKGALAEARGRVINVTPGQETHLLASYRAAIAASVPSTENGMYCPYCPHCQGPASSGQTRM
jgi:hypothetical protein